MNAKKPLSVLLGCALCLGFIASATAGPSRVSRMTFNQDTRKLWEDHILYTRLYIVDTLAGLPAEGATSKRLLENQVEIGGQMEPYYGEKAAGKLAALLKEHILIAAEVVDAAKKGDNARQNEASKRWYANSDEIAAFLESVNPKYWPAASMKKMLREHLDTTADEVADGLDKDWKADIAAYDKLHGQILEMADKLSSGIIKQFPDKFKK